MAKSEGRQVGDQTARQNGRANAPGQQGADSTQVAPGKSGESGRGHSEEGRAQREQERYNAEGEAAAEQETEVPPVDPNVPVPAPVDPNAPVPAPVDPNAPVA